MPSYDATGSGPPAPTSLVTLHNPDKGSNLTGIMMLLDTGADVTLIPRIAVERLGVSLEANAGFAVQGFDSNESLPPIATLQVIFLRKAFLGHYMVIEGETGILRRDILNHLVLLFDGPRQQWSQQ